MRGERLAAKVERLLSSKRSRDINPRTRKKLEKDLNKLMKKLNNPRSVRLNPLIQQTEYLYMKATGERSGTYRYMAGSIVYILVLTMLIRMIFIQAFRIPSGSMENTLLIGDFLLVNKLVYGVRTPERIPFTDVFLPSFRFPALRDPEPGDIIVFNYPEDRTKDFIKRCIAVEGQEIRIRNKKIFVDGMPVPEDFVKFTERRVQPPGRRDISNYAKLHAAWADEIPAGAVWNRDNFGPVTIPEDMLFMMGDNRDNSSDSRYWGFLGREDVKGRALITYFSWDGGNGYPFWMLWKKVRFSRMFRPIR